MKVEKKLEFIFVFVFIGEIFGGINTYSVVYLDLLYFSYVFWMCYLIFLSVDFFNYERLNINMLK